MAGRWQSRRKAYELGAWSATEPALPLWGMSKRELIEAALHLAARMASSSDDALANGDAALRVRNEVDKLRVDGLV